LAVPVIVRTILPLAVHFARRFFFNRRWISAAGLLEALSFPSRDRNFDYFPDDRLTSKSPFSRPWTVTGVDADAAAVRLFM